MGNRAVITTEARDLGVYLHWNGGRDSVEAFLLYCKIKEYRCPENDCYGWARLCQVIGNWFGGELSLGIDRYDKLDTDNGDNGVYIIKDWQIVGREFYKGEEQDTHNLLDMIKDINRCQPEVEQLAEDELIKAVNKLTQTSITPKQIKSIHTIVNELGFADNRYRQVLNSLFDTTSCKELTEKQASILIETLSKLKEK